MSAFQIIADSDTVLGFRFAGVDGLTVENADEARQAFQEMLNRGQCRILLLTNQVVNWIEDDVTAHRLSVREPFIVCIDDFWGRCEASKSLEQLIYEAVGIRIISEDPDHD